MVARGDALGYDGYQSGSPASGSLGSFFSPERVRQAPRSRLFVVISEPEWTQVFTKGSAKLMVQTLQKNIRVTPNQWKRIEKEAEERGISANRVVVELAMEALDHSEWPRTEHEIQLLRSAMFTAQAMVRDMERAERGEEIEEIRDFISTIVPDPDAKPSAEKTSASETGQGTDSESQP